MGSRSTASREQFLSPYGWGDHSPLRLFMHQTLDLSLHGVLDVILRVEAYGSVVGGAHHLCFVIQTGGSHKGLCSSVMTCANGFMLLHVEDRWRHYILKATHKHHICIPRSAETSFCYLKMPHTQTHLYFSDLLYSFLSSHIFILFFSLLHHLLTNGYSAVNGCRQNESSNS